MPTPETYISQVFKSIKSKKSAGKLDFLVDCVRNVYVVIKVIKVINVYFSSFTRYCVSTDLLITADKLFPPLILFVLTFQKNVFYMLLEALHGV